MCPRGGAQWHDGDLRNRPPMLPAARFWSSARSSSACSSLRNGLDTSETVRASDSDDSGEERGRRRRRRGERRRRPSETHHHHRRRPARRPRCRVIVLNGTATSGVAKRISDPLGHCWLPDRAARQRHGRRRGHSGVLRPWVRGRGGGRRHRHRRTGRCRATAPGYAAGEHRRCPSGRSRRSRSRGRRSGKAPAMAVAGAPSSDLLAPLRAEPDRRGSCSTSTARCPRSSTTPARLAARWRSRRLEDLARRFALVAVLSGRPVDFLKMLPAERGLSGSTASSACAAAAGATTRVPAVAARPSPTSPPPLVGRGPAGMRVERKGLSLTLHYRDRPRPRPSWLGPRGKRPARGLACAPAKMSVELHPPVDVDKGTAVDELCGELPAVVLRRRRRRRPARLRRARPTRPPGSPWCGSRSPAPRPPAALLDRADLVVDGPPGVRELLLQPLSA